MNIEQTEQQSLHISYKKLFTFVRAMIGGSRGCENDLPAYGRRNMEMQVLQ